MHFNPDSEEKWIVVQRYLAVRSTLDSELEPLDSMLRENDRDYIDQLQIRQQAYEDKVSQKTVDGRSWVYVVYYWKTKMTDEWKPGNVQCKKEHHLRTGELVDYVHFWVLRKSGEKFCLAVLAVALRYGYAAFHPNIKDMQPVEKWG